MSIAGLKRFRLQPDRTDGVWWRWTRIMICAIALGGFLAGCSALTTRSAASKQPELPTFAALEEGLPSGRQPDDTAGSGGEDAEPAAGRRAVVTDTRADPAPDLNASSTAYGVGGDEPATDSVDSARTEYSSRGWEVAEASRPDAMLPAITPSATPSPEVAAVTPAATRPFSYTVVSGDTLAVIAAKFGVSIRTITRANGLSETDILATGRNLVILPTSGTLHTVAEGETVPALAERYHVIPEEIAAANGLAEPDRIETGETLVIPESEGEDVTDAAKQAVRSNAAARGKQDYDVIRGDTLAKIAVGFGVSVAELAAANGLDVAKPLAIGQHLTIPPMGAVEHVVEKGDTVTRIAAKYSASAMAVIQANGLEDPYTLSLGRTLLVPGGTAPVRVPAATSTPAVAPMLTRLPTATATVARAATEAGSRNAYQVVRGDTLAKIAGRFGLSLAALVTANGLDVAKPLAIGQRLMIPAVTGSPPLVAGATISTPTQTPRPTPVATRTPTPVPAPRRQPTQAPVDQTIIGGKIVSIAMKYRGGRYVWGGASPQPGFDCSGFVMYVFRQAGLPVPRDLWGQMNAGTKVERGALKRGDVVFFRNTYTPGLSHDGIYIGDGQFIHAAGEQAGVIVSQLNSQYWTAHYLGATRLY